MKRHCSVILVRPDTMRFLMGRRRDSGKWCCPGGSVDPGESDGAAAARELLEEVGVEARPAYVSTLSASPAISVFVAVCDPGVEVSFADDPDQEFDAVMWASPDSLPPLHYGDRDVVVPIALATIGR